MATHMHNLKKVVNSVQVIKGGRNGSSAIDSVIRHELKDLAETVSKINQYQMLRLHLVETDNVSTDSSFEPEGDGAL